MKITTKNIEGVPDFEACRFFPTGTKYAICIPVINEGRRLHKLLERAQKHGIGEQADIIICDGGSTDGSTRDDVLITLGVNTLLTKTGPGKLGAQLRMGFWWALKNNYRGIITIDGNNKDSIESAGLFIKKLDEGYDFIQGSRYISGGKAIHTPRLRSLAVKYIHAPLISRAAKFNYTDTTNGFRGYSAGYLLHPEVKPFREVFQSYELLAYLSVKANRLGLKVCEIPVIRAYPAVGKTPTKISPLRGNFELLKILFKTVRGDYDI